MNNIVYDGGNQIYVPASMGGPKHNQLLGTVGEQLSEVGCRICYDSLGTGRSSEELHKHILDVKNHSVYEHYNFTVSFYCRLDNELKFYRALANRKGTYIYHKGNEIQITTNLRVILEWYKNPLLINNQYVHESLAYYGHKLCPQIISAPVYPDLSHSRLVTDDNELNEDQIWISCWLPGSRGLTHEQVRHRFAMSQRSTRYVDESDSEFIVHPLTQKFLKDNNVPVDDRHSVLRSLNEAAEHDKDCYVKIVEMLQTYLMDQGVDKLGARKQARGAARLHLPNGLASEMIYSAPISGWKWILSQRYNDLADAEIRILHANVYQSLKDSRYGKYFNDYEITDAKDGIGTVIK